MIAAIQGIDTSVLLYIQNYLRTPFWNAFFVFFSRLGDGGVLWIALGFVLLFLAKTRRRGFDVLLCLTFTFLAVNIILKPCVARTRPYNAINGLTILVPPLSDYSFPSGHASASFAAAFALMKGFGKRGAWVYLPAALIAVSRLWVGVHYPTDVICGAICGTLCAWAAWTVSNRYIRPGFLEPHGEE